MLLQRRPLRRSVKARSEFVAPRTCLHIEFHWHTSVQWSPGGTHACGRGVGAPHAGARLGQVLVLPARHRRAARAERGLFFRDDLLRCRVSLCAPRPDATATVLTRLFQWPRTLTSQLGPRPPEWPALPISSTFSGLGTFELAAEALQRAWLPSLDASSTTLLSAPSSSRSTANSTKLSAWAHQLLDVLEK